MHLFYDVLPCSILASITLLASNARVWFAHSSDLKGICGPTPCSSCVGRMFAGHVPVAPPGLRPKVARMMQEYPTCRPQIAHRAAAQMRVELRIHYAARSDSRACIALVFSHKV